MNNQETFESLQEISAFDIRTRFGATIASRGKSITNSVNEIVLCKGALLASVQGSEYEPYSTEVGLTEDGTIYSQCTCPYSTYCKHGAALLYSYLNLKKNVTVVVEDIRFELIKQSGELDENEDYEFDEDWEEYDDDECEDERPPVKAKPAPKAKEISLEKWLSKQPKESLKQLIISLADQFDIVSTHLNNQIRAESSGPNQLVGEIRRLMNATESYDSYGYNGYREWSGTERNETNLAGIGRCISKLTELKAFTELFSLKLELLTFMNQYVENDHYNDCAHMDLDVIVEPLIESVMKSNLTAVEKMNQLNSWEEMDEYGVFDEISVNVGDSLSTSEWSEWADISMERIDSIAGEYRAGKAIEKAVVALENAGREKEVIPFLQKNLEKYDITDLYLDKTEQQEQFDLFESYLIPLILKSERERSWKAYSFRTRFAESRATRKDLHAAFRIYRDCFLADPSAKNFSIVMKFAEKLGCQEQVKSWAVLYLETGTSENCPDQTESPLPVPQKITTVFPHKQLLLRIALDDKNRERAIQWYDFKNQFNKEDLTYSNEFAHLIMEEFPDRSISIWVKLAIDQIERTSNEGYEEGGKFLSKVKKLLVSLDRKGEWDSISERIGKEYKRKRNFMAILKMIG